MDEWSKAWQGDTTEEYRRRAAVCDCEASASSETGGSSKRGKAIPLKSTGGADRLGPDLPLKARPTGRGRVKRKIRVRRLAVQVRGRA